MANACASKPVNGNSDISEKITENSVKETAPAAAAEPVTESFSFMQKTFAEKAIKMINNNNPVVLHKFTADPCVLVYKDTVYLYGTNDSQQAEFSKGEQDNNYNRINTLNMFCSKDLVNWTDLGEIPVAGARNPKGAAKWATNSWAPAICWKNVDGKDKFFLYFADSGNGIGVLSADSPTGPFIDPIGKPLVSRSTPNCQNVYWMFDPAVMVDDDGKGYLYFGGGHKDDVAHPKSSRAVALGDDMISLAGDPIELDPPFLFEDSGINKINGKYYYSYCSNWSDRSGATGDVPPTAVIAYMTSDSPLGPFTYGGYTFSNPGSYFGAWGNNHHWIFEFKGKYYIAYHAQIVEKKIGFTKGGYRNLMISEFQINDDGTLPIQKANLEGVNPVCNFDPTEKIPAATMHSIKNVVVTSQQTLYPMKNNGYICIKDVDFSKINENSKIKVELSPDHKGGRITFRLDNFGNGPVLGEISVNDETSAEITIDTTSLEEQTVHNLYIVFEDDVELVNWTIN